MLKEVTTYLQVLMQLAQNSQAGGICILRLEHPVKVHEGERNRCRLRRGHDLRRRPRTPKHRQCIRNLKDVSNNNKSLEKQGNKRD